MKNNKGFAYKEYEIISKEELAPDSFLFSLKGEFKSEPGQFIQAALDHYGEATFAICSDPEQKKSFDICIRAAGGTTNRMIELSPRDLLKIRGPYGNGWPISKLLGKNVILIAGGMGLVPLKPLIFNLIRYKSEFKKIYVVAGFKTDHHVLFKDELEQLRKKINIKVMAEHSSGGFWGGQGLITEALETIVLDGKKTIVLMCGPEIMIPHCNDVLFKKGIPEENIYISFERRMECGIGICQHCNIGKFKVCDNGPVFRFDEIKNEIGK
ncbi:MAG: FAD/NAD(P)-binding protein [Patescibacteria group bacterium]|nr:FAD/NAD(P)-binding protein [Patescibacteria group bacterium]